MRQGTPCGQRQSTRGTSPQKAVLPAQDNPQGPSMSHLEERLYHVLVIIVLIIARARTTSELICGVSCAPSFSSHRINSYWDPRASPHSLTGTVRMDLHPKFSSGLVLTRQASLPTPLAHQPTSPRACAVAIMQGTHPSTGINKSRTCPQFFGGIWDNMACVNEKKPSCFFQDPKHWRTTLPSFQGRPHPCWFSEAPGRWEALGTRPDAPALPSLAPLTQLWNRQIPPGIQQVIFPLEFRSLLPSGPFEKSQVSVSLLHLFLVSTRCGFTADPVISRLKQASVPLPPQ